jgi:hypothetical protein
VSGGGGAPVLAGWFTSPGGCRLMCSAVWRRRGATAAVDARSREALGALRAQLQEQGELGVRVRDELAEVQSSLRAQVPTTAPAPPRCTQRLFDR